MVRKNTIIFLINYYLIIKTIRQITAFQLTVY